jgi:hypothetical protein
MKFTFGVITAGGEEARIREVIRSIDSEFCGHLDDYEIICIGGVKEYTESDNILYVPFDESKRPGHITKKKNMIAKLARFDNLFLLHDYVKLCEGFKDGWDKFGDDWEISMNVVLNVDGQRFRDHCVWDDPAYPPPWTCVEKPWPNGIRFAGTAGIVPYSYNKQEYMYWSGAYLVMKRYVLVKEPFDERLGHCEAEDVEHALRIRTKFKYTMNPNSAVQLLKPKNLGIRNYS